MIRKAAKDCEVRAFKKENVIIIALVIIVLGIIALAIINSIVSLNAEYNNAIVLMDAARYQEAIFAFEKLDGYKDSEEKISECNIAILDEKYNDAVALMEEGIYQKAISVFEGLDGYKDSIEKISECNTAIFDGEYNTAVELMKAGSYIDAYEKLIELGEYKDSSKKAKEIFNKYKIEKLQLAEVGAYVTFGSYEQDNNASNGEEDIKWLVLDKEDNKLLLISVCALDCRPYNEIDNDITWEACTLRKWLNNYFFNNAFAEEEKAFISNTEISAEKNYYEKLYFPDMRSGNVTSDKIFLLSIDEVKKYFGSEETRQCRPTNYARKNGVDINDNGKCWWWLRSPGWYQNSAAHVNNNGVLTEVLGMPVDYDRYGVRPALWIELKG